VKENGSTSEKGFEIGFKLPGYERIILMEELALSARPLEERGGLGEIRP
jgi:hypothetical protein